MTTKKGETRAKKPSRTPLELAESQANRLVTQLDSTLNNLSALRRRINILPSGDFSSYAKGFNLMVNQTQETLLAMPFAVTDKPEDIVQVEKTARTFSDLISESEATESDSETPGDWTTIPFYFLFLI